MTTRTAHAVRNTDTRDFEAIVEIVHTDGRRELVSCGHRDTEAEALDLASENLAAMARRARNQAAAAEAEQLALEARAALADEQVEAEALWAEWERPGVCAERCAVCGNHSVFTGKNHGKRCDFCGDELYGDEQAERPRCELCEAPAVLVGEQWTCPACCPVYEDAEAEAWAQAAETCDGCGGQGETVEQADGRLLCAWCAGFRAPGRFGRFERDVYDFASNRWYCTAASWPYSPAARAGAEAYEVAA